MQESLTIAGCQTLIDLPENMPTRGIIYLPGISAHALGERRADLGTNAVERGMACLRFESRKDRDDLAYKTYHQIHQELDAMIEALLARGCTSIGLVAKSFGGGVALTYHNTHIQRMVLWAPAIGIDDSFEISPEVLASPVGTTSLHLTTPLLQSRQIPVRILHGTADPVVPVENSQQIMQKLPHAELILIDGADHGYHEPEHHKKLIKDSLDFFVNS